MTTSVAQEIKNLKKLSKAPSSVFYPAFMKALKAFDEQSVAEVQKAQQEEAEYKASPEYAKKREEFLARRADRDARWGTKR